MVSAHQERIAANEDAFRKRNEMLRLGQGGEGDMLFLCECGDRECAQPIHMNLEEYERLRDHHGRFAIVRGHEIPEVEHVVERHGGYDTVEKLEQGSEEAAGRDPR